MTNLYYDTLFLEHRMPAGHPERPDRVGQTWEALEQAGLVAQCQRGTGKPAAREHLAEIHSENMLKSAETLCAQGGGYLDGDTPVAPRSLEAARLAAGYATAAVDDVLAGKCHNAFCLVRPPGHHATPLRSMGFCLVNNIALAAKHALTRHQLSRILIIDWDVHHGNGTQDVFYEDPQVMFFSAHRFPFYPGSGRSDENGAGRGFGYTINMPVPYGTPASVYRQWFQKNLDYAAAKIKPELVLLSAGFDAHRLDPIGCLDLENEDFLELGKMVLQVADTFADGRLVSLLEGGYNIDALRECVVDHVRQLLNA